MAVCPAERREQTARETFVVFLVLGTVTAGALALLSDWLVPFAFGTSYRDGSTLLALLAAGLIGVGYQFASLAYVMAGGTSVNKRKTLVPIYGLVVLVVWIALSVGYAVEGTRGFAIGQALADIVVGIGLALVTRRNLNWHRLDFVVAGGGTAVLGLVLATYSPQLAGVVVLSAGALMTLFWRRLIADAIRTW
jgi:O-antigen/teichoic acid export membrane protein